MKVGNLVEPISWQFTLASGCGRYPHAYVVNLAPFQLMSEEGDMYWCSDMKQDGYKVISDSTEIPQGVLDRMTKEGLIKPASELQTGFNAFGKEVPEKRINAAREWLEADFPNKGPFERGYILGCALRGIKNDRPQNIFDDLKHELDTTAIYRLIAILCTDEQTVAQTLAKEGVSKTFAKLCSCVETRTITNGICNRCGGYEQW